MAYIQEQLTDEERKKQQEQGAGAPIADQAGAPVSGGTIAPGGEEKAPTGGGGGTRSFTDVRSFLEANRPQAQELAKNVGSKIESEAQSAQKAIKDTGEQYKSQIEQGSIRTEPVKGLIQEAGMSPQEVLKRQADVAKLANVRTGQFTGPRAVSSQDTATLQRQAQEAQRKAALTESQAGREELLGLTGGKSTKGGLQLDQLLLSQTPEARAALEQAGQASKGLDTALQSTIGDVSQFAQQAEQETGATKALFGETFGKAKTEFQKQLDERLRQAQEQAQARAATAKGALGAGQYDEQALLDLGIKQEDLAGILQAQKDLSTDYGQNIDLNEYLQQTGPNFNRSQVATQEDLAKQQALEELAGNQFGVIGNQVGGANLDLTDFSGEQATASTRGGLSSRDRALIDRYYNRENLEGQESKALKNALKREAAYAATKTMAPKPEGPDLVDTIMTDPLTGINMGDVGSKLEQAKKEVDTAVDSTLVKPVRDVRDEINRTVDTVKNTLGSGVTEPVKEVLKTLDPREQVEAIKEIAKDPVKAVEKVAKKVENTVKKIFCFAAESFFVMADNTTKAVEDIKLGDNMKDGGVVYSIRQSFIDEDVFNYGGVTVTGSHAVNEDGQWIRVGNSKKATPVSFSGVVYSICNENHKMVSNADVLFADEQETDDYEDLTIEESLQELNSRNGHLVGVN